MLYSYEPWFNYLSVHLLLTAVFHIFPWVCFVPRLCGSYRFFLQLLSAKVVDTLLPLLDAILRTRTITSSLNLIPTSPNPSVANSIVMQWIIGAVSSSGGGQLAATFGVWKPFKDWSLLAKPVVLKGGVLATLDVWGGILAGPSFQVLLIFSHINYFVLNSVVIRDAYTFPSLIHPRPLLSYFSPRQSRKDARDVDVHKTSSIHEEERGRDEQSRSYLDVGIVICD
jgi:hypothetical protein